MDNLLNIFKQLTELDSPSGNEDAVRDFIFNEIKDLQ